MQDPVTDVRIRDDANPDAESLNRIAVAAFGQFRAYAVYSKTL